MKCELPSGCALQAPVQVFTPGLQPESLQAPIKTEVPITNPCFSDLKKFLPGELSTKMEEEIDNFIFPVGNYPSDFVRRTEIQLSKKYLSRSTIFAYYFEENIIASCRVISKHYDNQELPIEAASIMKFVERGQIFSDCLSPGDLFSVNPLSNLMPSCEIAGLRCIDTVCNRAINNRIRYQALSSVLYSCQKEVFLQGYNSSFLTCMGSPQLERLYEGKFGFHEFAEMSYGGERIWKGLFWKKR